MQKSEVNRVRASVELWASNQSPQDGFTKTAHTLANVLESVVSIPIIVLQLFTTFVLGIAGLLTFGIALIPFVMVLWLLNIATVGSSWAWINFPIARPLLFVPGVFFSVVQSSFTALLPYGGDWNSRANDMARSQSWPWSYHVQQLPNRHREALIEWELLVDAYEKKSLTLNEMMYKATPIWNFLNQTAPELAVVIDLFYDTHMEEE